MNLRRWWLQKTSRKDGSCRDENVEVYVLLKSKLQCPTPSYMQATPSYNQATPERNY